MESSNQFKNGAFPKSHMSRNSKTNYYENEEIIYALLHDHCFCSCSECTSFKC